MSKRSGPSNSSKDSIFEAELLRAHGESIEIVRSQLHDFKITVNGLINTIKLLEENVAESLDQIVANSKVIDHLKGNIQVIEQTFKIFDSNIKESMDKLISNSLDYAKRLKTLEDDTRSINLFINAIWNWKVLLPVLLIVGSIDYIRIYTVVQKMIENL